MLSVVVDWLFATGNFLPHGFCLTGDNDVIALNVVSDLGIALAYFAIPSFLVVILVKRRDLTLPWPFTLFATFILLCGTTHVIEIVTYWEPLYVLQGVAKAATALVSLATAVILWPMLPHLLAITSPEQMKRANLGLERQLVERTETTNELVRFNALLELRVAERTADLRRINAELEAEIEINGRIAAELVLSRDEALNANNVKSMFLAAMSHDLRTPLNAIIGFSDMILSEIHGPIGEPRYGGYLEDIHVSGYLLLSLIDNILDLSKIEAGKRAFAPDRLDGGCLVKACLRLLQAEIEAKRIDVAVSVDPTAEIYADDLAFRQVTLNLLSNAVKFTPIGGRIALRIQPVPSGGAAIEISDNGSGMSDVGMREAMEPFGKPGAMTARPEGAGSGLGISIVIRLMALHGGHFSLDSAVGRGTTARLDFPPRAQAA
jgi:signal transduction histidine kinase